MKSVQIFVFLLVLAFLQLAHGGSLGSEPRHKLVQQRSIASEIQIDLKLIQGDLNLAESEALGLTEEFENADAEFKVELKPATPSNKSK